MNDERRSVPARWVLFWSIALGGAAFDLATKADRLREDRPAAGRAPSR